jgi:hypothetical protein
MSTVMAAPGVIGHPSDRRTTPTSAVVWINGRHAVVARMDAAGRITTCEIERGLEPEPSYLRLVIRALGDRERVVILGPSSVRLALEREYVAIYRRPDRLVDVEPSGLVDEAELVDRLRQLSALTVT